MFKGSRSLLKNLLQDFYVEKSWKKWAVLSSMMKDTKAPFTIPLLPAYLHSFQEQFAHIVLISKLMHREERNMVPYQNYEAQKMLN